MLTKRKVLQAALVVLVPAMLAILLVLIQTPRGIPANLQAAISGNTAAAGDFMKVLDCFGGEISKKCLDDFIAGYAGDKTVKQLLADLETNRGKNTTIENDCHPIAHAIGRYAYQKYGNIGDAFLACDQTCHSGCYHGVMERLFYTPEQLAANTAHLTFADMQVKVPHICDADKFQNPSQAVIFQCLHGVGHAILYSLNYNLEEALRSCDLFATDYEKQSCYGGVIMENITAFDRDKRDLKSDDPQYPCDKLEEKYKYSCYQMQTSVMTEQKLTNEQIAAECRKAGNFMAPCFVSLGRDLSNYVRTGQTDMVVNVCENISGDQILNCTEGTVYALIDNTWDTSFAYPFCAAFKQESNQRMCFVASNNYAHSIYNRTREEQQTACDRYAGDKAELCKQVATL